MPRHLLTTTAAFVLAAAASAQTVALSGQVTTFITFDNSPPNPLIDGPSFGGHGGDGLFLTISGSGGGWDYELSNDLFHIHNWDGSVLTLSHAGFGTFELGDDTILWERSFVEDTFTIGTFFHPQFLEDSLIVYLEGVAGGVSYEAEIHNDGNQSFELDVSAPLMGVDLGVDLFGTLPNTSNLNYNFELVGNAFGVDTSVAWSRAGDIVIEAQAGPFYAETFLTDGDFFNDLSFVYHQEITEQMEVTAEVHMNSGSTSGSAQLQLTF